MRATLRVRLLCDAIRFRAPLGPPLRPTNSTPRPSATNRRVKARTAMRSGRLPGGAGEAAGERAAGPHRRRPEAKLWTAGATVRKSASSVASASRRVRSSSETTSATAPCGRLQRQQVLDEDVDPAARGGQLLQPPVGQHQRLGAHEQALALVDGRRDDQVDGPELVLEQQEDDALGRARALARDDEPADPHPRVVPRAPRGRGRTPCRPAAAGAAAPSGGARASARWWRSRRSSPPTARARAARARRAASSGSESCVPSWTASPGRGDPELPQDLAAGGGALPRSESQAPAHASCASAGRPAPAREARSPSERNGPPASRASTSAATSSERTPLT